MLLYGQNAIFSLLQSGREKVFNILLFNNFYAMGIGSFIVPFYFNLVSFKEFIVLIIIALCMLIGQFCFIKSVKQAETSFLMPFFFTTLIFVIILDFIFFNSLPDKISYLGATIIIIGSLVVAFRELNNNKPNN